MNILHTAGLVVLKDRKLLLAYSNNKKAFYLPGGKIDQGETSIAALIREIHEELSITLNPGEIRFYTHIEAFAYGEQEGTVMKQDCFMADLPDTIAPAAEIGDLQYFNTSDYRNEPQQVPGVLMVMEKLKKDGLID